MKKYLILITIFCVSLEGYSRTKERRISQSDSAIELQVTFGEKTTLFEIRNNPAPFIDYSNNWGEKSSKNLKTKDYQFILKKVQAMSGGSENVTIKCSREFIQLSTPDKRFSSCLQGKSKLSQDLRDLANTLGLLF